MKGGGKKVLMSYFQGGGHHPQGGAYHPHPDRNWLKDFLKGAKSSAGPTSDQRAKNRALYFEFMRNEFFTRRLGNARGDILKEVREYAKEGVLAKSLKWDFSPASAFQTLEQRGDKALAHILSERLQKIGAGMDTTLRHTAMRQKRNEGAFDSNVALALAAVCMGFDELLKEGVIGVVEVGEAKGRGKRDKVKQDLVKACAIGKAFWDRVQKFFKHEGGEGAGHQEGHPVDQEQLHFGRGVSEVDKLHTLTLKAERYGDTTTSSGNTKGGRPPAAPQNALPPGAFTGDYVLVRHTEMLKTSKSEHDAKEGLFVTLKKDYYFWTKKTLQNFSTGSMQKTDKAKHLFVEPGSRGRITKVDVAGPGKGVDYHVTFHELPPVRLTYRQLVEKARDEYTTREKLLHRKNLPLHQEMVEIQGMDARELKKRKPEQFLKILAKMEEIIQTSDFELLSREELRKLEIKGDKSSSSDDDLPPGVAWDRFYVEQPKCRLPFTRSETADRMRDNYQISAEQTLWVDGREKILKEEVKTLADMVEAMISELDEQASHFDKLGKSAMGQGAQGNDFTNLTREQIREMDLLCLSWYLKNNVAEFAHCAAEIGGKLWRNYEGKKKHEEGESGAHVTTLVGGIIEQGKRVLLKAAPDGANAKKEATKQTFLAYWRKRVWHVEERRVAAGNFAVSRNEAANRDDPQHKDGLKRAASKDGSEGEARDEVEQQDHDYRKLILPPQKPVGTSDALRAREKAVQRDDRLKNGKKFIDSSDEFRVELKAHLKKQSRRQWLAIAAAAQKDALAQSGRLQRLRDQIVDFVILSLLPLHETCQEQGHVGLFFKSRYRSLINGADHPSSGAAGAAKGFHFFEHDELLPPLRKHLALSIEDAVRKKGGSLQDQLAAARELKRRRVDERERKKATEAEVLAPLTEDDKLLLMRYRKLQELDERKLRDESKVADLVERYRGCEKKLKDAKYLTLPEPTEGHVQVRDRESFRTVGQWGALREEERAVLRLELELRNAAGGETNQARVHWDSHSVAFGEVEAAEVAWAGLLRLSREGTLAVSVPETFQYVACQRRMWKQARAEEKQRMQESTAARAFALEDSNAAGDSGGLELVPAASRSRISTSTGGGLADQLMEQQEQELYVLETEPCDPDFPDAAKSAHQHPNRSWTAAWVRPVPTGSQLRTPLADDEARLAELKRTASTGYNQEGGVLGLKMSKEERKRTAEEAKKLEETVRNILPISRLAKADKERGNSWYYDVQVEPDREKAELSRTPLLMRTCEGLPTLPPMPEWINSKVRERKQLPKQSRIGLAREMLTPVPTILADLYTLGKLLTIPYMDATERNHLEVDVQLLPTGSLCLRVVPTERSNPMLARRNKPHLAPGTNNSTPSSPAAAVMPERHRLPKCECSHDGTFDYRVLQGAESCEYQPSWELARTSLIRMGEREAPTYGKRSQEPAAHYYEWQLNHHYVLCGKAVEALQGPRGNNPQPISLKSCWHPSVDDSFVKRDRLQIWGETMWMGKDFSMKTKSVHVVQNQAQNRRKLSRKLSMQLLVQKAQRVILDDIYFHAPFLCYTEETTFGCLRYPAETTNSHSARNAARGRLQIWGETMWIGFFFLMWGETTWTDFVFIFSTLVQFLGKAEGVRYQLFTAADFFNPQARNSMGYSRTEAFKYVSHLFDWLQATIAEKEGQWRTRYKLFCSSGIVPGEEELQSLFSIGGEIRFPEKVFHAADMLVLRGMPFNHEQPPCTPAVPYGWVLRYSKSHHASYYEHKKQVREKQQNYRQKKAEKDPSVFDSKGNALPMPNYNLKTWAPLFELPPGYLCKTPRAIMNNAKQFTVEEDPTTGEKLKYDCYFLNSFLPDEAKWTLPRVPAREVAKKWLSTEQALKLAIMVEDDEALEAQIRADGPKMENRVAELWEEKRHADDEAERLQLEMERDVLRLEDCVGGEIGDGSRDDGEQRDPMAMEVKVDNASLGGDSSLHVHHPGVSSTFRNEQIGGSSSSTFAGKAAAKKNLRKQKKAAETEDFEDEDFELDILNANADVTSSLPPASKRRKFDVEVVEVGKTKTPGGDHEVQVVEEERGDAPEEKDASPGTAKSGASAKAKSPTAATAKAKAKAKAKEKAKAKSEVKKTSDKKVLSAMKKAAPGGSAAQEQDENGNSPGKTGKRKRISTDGALLELFGGGGEDEEEEVEVEEQEVHGATSPAPPQETSPAPELAAAAPPSIRLPIPAAGGGAGGTSAARATNQQEPEDQLQHVSDLEDSEIEILGGNPDDPHSMAGLWTAPEDANTLLVITSQEHERSGQRRVLVAAKGGPMKGAGKPIFSNKGVEGARDGKGGSADDVGKR
eukprot:g9520.t1